MVRLSQILMRLNLFKSMRYREAISLKTGIPAHKLVVKVSEGFPAKTTYWVHPELAIKLGRWISVEFELWCDEHIKTLIETGTAAITPQLPQTYIEALKALVAAEEEKERLAHDNNRLKEVVDELFSYSSIIRIAKYLNPQLSFAIY